MASSRARLSLPADMKQGLLSVGIGGRESRSGCLDVEKGESLASWHLQDGEEGADMRGEGEDRDAAWT